MNEPLHQLAAITHANTLRRHHACDNCDRLYRTIEQILFTQQYPTLDSLPTPTRPVQYEPLPDSLVWLITRHPNLWWLATLPQDERDWYQPHKQRLANIYKISMQELELIFDPTLREEPVSA